MRNLVDAHSLIWALDDPSRLGAGAIAALQTQENELLLSAGTIWELSIKVGLAKLTLSLPFVQWIEKAIADLELTVLPITVIHAGRQAELPFHHRDPFDRLLAAQALVESIPLVSADVIRSIWGDSNLDLSTANVSSNSHPLGVGTVALGLAGGSEFRIECARLVKLKIYGNEKADPARSRLLLLHQTSEADGARTRNHRIDSPVL